ncbi:tetratricopeptide repeat protein [Patescibacteria group bacterium]|nr:tetratricopeptide repeat protein [Patescibacteria group bacterium]
MNTTNELSGVSSNKKKTTLDTIVLYLIMSLGCVVPVLFLDFLHIPLTVSKGGVLFIIILLSFILWLVARLKEGKFIIPQSSILIAICGLPIVFILSALFSDAFWVSLLGSGYELGTVLAIFLFTVLVFLTATLFQSYKNIYQFLLLLLVAGTLSFVYMIIMQVGNIQSSAFPCILIGTYNDMAMFLGLTTIIVMSTLELVTLNKRMRIMMIISFVTSLLGLLILNFSFVWNVLGVFSLILFVYVYSFSGNSTGNTTKERKISVLPIIVMTIVLLLVLPGRTIGDFVAEKFQVTNVSIRPSWHSTAHIIKTTLKESPMFGVGPNRFASAWLANKPDGINQTVAWNTNFPFGVGIIPSFLVTTGAIGGLAWIVFLVIFLVRGAQTVILKIKTDKTARYLTFSLFLSTVYLWLMSIFYVPNIVGFSLAFLMTGMFIASLAQSGAIKKYSVSFSSDPRVSFVSVLGLILSIIISVSGGNLLFQRLAATGYFQQANIILNTDNTNLEGAKNKLRQAIAMAPRDEYYRNLTTLHIIELNGLVNLPIETAKVQFNEITPEIINNALKATEIDKTNYLNWIVLAQAYESLIPFFKQQGEGKDGYDEAKAAYEIALTYNPQSPLIKLLQARLEMTKGHNKQAKEYIQESIKMKNNYPEAIFFYSQLQAAEGDLEQAIRSAEIASMLKPNNIGILFQWGFLKYQHKDYKGAISVFERIVELNNSYSNARYFLGLSYENVDDTAKAIEQMERIQELDPNNTQQIKDILTNLRAGRDPFYKSSFRLTAPTPEDSEEVSKEE